MRLLLSPHKTHACEASGKVGGSACYRTIGGRQGSAHSERRVRPKTAATGSKEPAPITVRRKGRLVTQSGRKVYEKTPTISAGVSCGEHSWEMLNTVTCVASRRTRTQKKMGPCGRRAVIAAMMPNYLGRSVW